MPVSSHKHAKRNKGHLVLSEPSIVVEVAITAVESASAASAATKPPSASSSAAKPAAAILPVLPIASAVESALAAHLRPMPHTPPTLAQVTVLQLRQRRAHRELTSLAMLLRLTSHAHAHLDEVLEHLHILVRHVEHGSLLVLRHRDALDVAHHLLGEVAAQRTPHVRGRAELVEGVVLERLVA